MYYDFEILNDWNSSVGKVSAITLLERGFYEDLITDQGLPFNEKEHKAQEDGE